MGVARKSEPRGEGHWLQTAGCCDSTGLTFTPGQELQALQLQVNILTPQLRHTMGLPHQDWPLVANPSSPHQERRAKLSADVDSMVDTSSYLLPTSRLLFPSLLTHFTEPSRPHPTAGTTVLCTMTMLATACPHASHLSPLPGLSHSAIIHRQLQHLSESFLHV